MNINQLLDLITNARPLQLPKGWEYGEDKDFTITLNKRDLSCAILRLPYGDHGIGFVTKRSDAPVSTSTVVCLDAKELIGDKEQYSVEDAKIILDHFANGFTNNAFSRRVYKAVRILVDRIYAELLANETNPPL